MNVEIASLPAPSAPRSAASERPFEGRFAIERELGRGAMGVVYRARDLGLDRLVALKVIAPELAHDANAAAQFRREASALARLRSEHVVQVYSLGSHERAPFFAMEYVEGASLDAIIASYAERGEVVPFHRAATILDQVAGGLAAVHAHGMLHRDVKPANVQIEAGSGRPVLIDFGLAGAIDVASIGFGTPHYMAPELWDGDLRTTAASDVYALGVTAFELLTGAQPFDGETVQDIMLAHSNQAIPKLSARRAPLARLDDVIARALAKEPHHRWPDAGAFRRAFVERARPLLPRVVPAIDTSVVSPSYDGACLDALVIDDDETFRAFAERALRVASGGVPLRVRSAASGDAAIAMAGAAMPDLVLLDFDLPDLDALAILSQLRALPRGSHARVVVVSGRVDGIGRCQFDVMGVNDFIEKPIPLRALAGKIGEIVRRG